jgi:hypothetical protein
VNGSPLSLISENVFKLEPSAAANGIKLKALKQSQGRVENLLKKKGFRVKCHKKNR